MMSSQIPTLARGRGGGGAGVVGISIDKCITMTGKKVRVPMLVGAL